MILTYTNYACIFVSSSASKYLYEIPDRFCASIVHCVTNFFGSSI